MNDSPRLKKWFIIFGLFNFLLISGLIIAYQQLYSTSREILPTQHQLKNIIEKQKVINKSLKTIHQQLHQKQSQVTLLNQTLWLIRQAKWQVNIMHQTNSSEHLLKYAQKIAAANQWVSLNDAINQDLTRLRKKKLISDNDFIEQIQSLYQQIEIFKKHVGLHQALAPRKITPPMSQNTPINKLLDYFRPFLRIERFHEDTPKILPPTQQFQVLSNMLMLLTEMQMTGLNRDDTSYRMLAKELYDNWNMLSPQLHEIEITDAIEKLQNAPLILEKPIFFSSLAEVHYLLNTADTNI